MEKIEYYTSPQNNHKQNFKIISPISLFPIFNNIFEKTIFNKTYIFFKTDNS